MIPIVRPTFRVRLLTAMLMLNMLAIAVVAGTLQQLYRWTIREAEIRTQSVALAIDLHLSSEANMINLSLSTVASEISHYLRGGHNLGPSHINAMISRHHTLLPETEGWSFVDAEGWIVFHDGKGDQPSFSLADRDYFQELKTGRISGLHLSKPLQSRLTGNSVMIFSRAVTDENGRFLGIVLVSQPLSYFRTILSGFDLGPNGSLTLRHADLGIIARAPLLEENSPDILSDSNISRQLKDILAAGLPRATYHAVTPFDGVERILSYRKLNNAPIHVVAGVAKDDFLKGWRHTLFIFLGLLGLFLFILNVATALLYRQWQRHIRDAGALKESHDLLAESLKDLQERDSALIAAEDAGRLGTYVLYITTQNWQASPRLNAIFGIDHTYPHTVEGWLRLVHPDDRKAMTAYFSEEVLGKLQIFDIEYRIVRPSDGQSIWVHGLGKLVFDSQGQPARMSGTIQDISARKLSEERLQLAHEAFQSAVEGIIFTDRDGDVLDTNPSFTRITGYSREEAIGRNLKLLKSDILDAAFISKLWDDLNTHGYWEGEFVNQRKDGTQYVQHTRISAICDAKGGFTHFAAVISDVTELKESQKRLEYLAYYDDLTGLPNRALLSDRMRQAIAQCNRQKNKYLSLCLLDIDGFKDINEKWGQEIGDQLLIRVARKLEDSKRSSDTVARLGGDEFVALFCNLDDDLDSKNAISRLLQSIGVFEPIGVGSPSITFSAGVTLYPNNTTEEPDVLLRQAGHALYEAKRSGKNCVRYFDSESEQRLSDHQAQLTCLGEALRNGQFRLFYQPKIDLRTGAVVGVEALLRWQHPERGLLQPYEFLSVLEASELTTPVGEWIIAEALRQQREWVEEGLEVQVSVNLFGLHLQRSDFVERVDAILQAHPENDPTMLDFEIVETTALENLKEITARIHGCKRLGIGFSLDDFGTGYSSLTYVRQLPVCKIKVDRSFVRDILHNKEDRALVENIIDMAHTLDRQVVAEGLETIEHGVPLIRCGCDYGQGYGIARPMPPADLIGWVAQWRMPTAWSDAVSSAGARVT